MIAGATNMGHDMAAAPPGPAACQRTEHLEPSAWVKWSGRRESNPRMQLGKLPFYH